MDLVASAGEGHQGSNVAAPSGEEGKGSTVREGRVCVYKLTSCMDTKTIRNLKVFLLSSQDLKSHSTLSYVNE